MFSIMYALLSIFLILQTKAALGHWKTLCKAKVTSIYSFWASLFEGLVTVLLTQNLHFHILLTRDYTTENFYDWHTFPVTQIVICCQSSKPNRFLAKERRGLVLSWPLVVTRGSTVPPNRCSWGIGGVSPLCHSLASTLLFTSASFPFNFLNWEGLCNKMSVTADFPEFVY